MSNVVPFNPVFSKPPVVQGSTVDAAEFGAGIAASFAVLSYKGKTWSVRAKGNVQQLLVYDQQGNVIGSVPSVEVVVVRASPALSKAYYIKDYVEGDVSRPDCWSMDSLKPDPTVINPQNPVCATCKWNQFGSKVTNNGVRSKACSDGKRLAIVPADDLESKIYGGPLLLKVPPGSHQSLLEYLTRLGATGWRPDFVTTRLSFDTAEAFPKIIFREIRPLTPDEMAKVFELQRSPIVARIINEMAEFGDDVPQSVHARPEPKPAAPTAAAQPAPSTPPAAQQGPQGSGFGTPPSPAATQAQPAPAATAAPAAGIPSGETEADLLRKKLAEAEAKLAATETKPPRQRKARTPPVSPQNVTVAGAEPPTQAAPGPFNSGFGPPPAQGASPASPETDQEETAAETTGDAAMEDLSGRLNKLLS